LSESLPVPISFPSFLMDGRKPVIFCDFDGTLTERDVIIMIMEAFAPPEWKQIVDGILNSRTISIRDGVIQLFHLIPAHQRLEIEAFVSENVVLRSGLDGLLGFCHQHHIPFNVLSGGIDFFVQPVLKPFHHRLQIFCNQARFDGEQIELMFPYAPVDCTQCGNCGCCKINLMDRYPASDYYRIAIGDSLTDLPMAQLADWTFARGQLIQYCQEEQIPTTPFETFTHIQEALQLKLMMTSSGATVSPS
jgi:2-hydroxy-3-keto-5-methylthiopentenyl-1-phosphate phosphatase